MESLAAEAQYIVIRCLVDAETTKHAPSLAKDVTCWLDHVRFPIWTCEAGDSAIPHTRLCKSNACKTADCSTLNGLDRLFQPGINSICLLYYVRFPISTCEAGDSTIPHTRLCKLNTCKTMDYPTLNGRLDGIFQLGVDVNEAVLWIKMSSRVLALTLSSRPS